jgi:DNA-binding GntR family transcriptional regulator
MILRRTAHSLPKRVYACLRADILAGRFSPGQRLSPAELTALHVSGTAWSANLNRLTGARLVRASPRQASAAAEVRAPDLGDLSEIRVLVETSALRLSIEDCDLTCESAVVAAHHRFAKRR